MKLTPDPLPTFRYRYLPLLDRLEKLFGQMDRAYSAVAGRYGFQCSGCADNCCLTRFHHHTRIEYLFLVEGLRTLEPDVRQAVEEQALLVSTATADADRRDEALRIMCPLNRNERCMLYPYRPMICRLHGIPHELHRPDGNTITYPGCDAFLSQCQEHGKTDYIPFDRTPFYRQMAALEQELRGEMGYSGNIKLTIAQMIVTIMDRDDEMD